jgi:hypothetical protein
VLNGSKIYASNGAIAEFITVFATADKSLQGKGIRAFVVPRDAPGLSITKANEEKMGVRSWLTSAFALDDCVLPLDHCIGMAPDGSTPALRSGRGAALRALANNRPNVASMGRRDRPGIDRRDRRDPAGNACGLCAAQVGGNPGRPQSHERRARSVPPDELPVAGAR